MSLTFATNNEVAFVPPEAQQWNLRQTVQAEGSPPDDELKFLMPDFDPRMRYNGAPPVYEGPTVKSNPYGSEEPLQILDRNGQVMAEFPPGTVIHKKTANQPFLDEQYPQDPGSDSPYAVLRSNYFASPDGSEAGVFEVQLPPKRLREGDRLLIPSEQETLIVSVERSQFSRSENIPFPSEEIWQDLGESFPNGGPVTYDLLRVGGKTIIARTEALNVKSDRVVPEGADRFWFRWAQFAFWNSEQQEWQLLQDSILGSYEDVKFTLLSNGTLLVETEQLWGDFFLPSFDLYSLELGDDKDAESGEGINPKLNLLRRWNANVEKHHQEGLDSSWDYAMSPDGRDMLYVTKTQNHRTKAESAQVFVESGVTPSADLTTQERSEPVEIAKLPWGYSDDPRLSVSIDGSAVAVVSSYSLTEELTSIDGRAVIPDYQTIHGKKDGQQIRAAMLTVLKKGADGQWHSHHVALPEGWGMAGRYLLSWDADGNLRISQFDSSKPEGEEWSHHFVNTSSLETGILPYETFFVSNPENVNFQNGVLTITDSNGKRREFIVGVQPEDGRLARLRSDVSLAQDGKTMWFTYDSGSETLNHGISDYTLGFAGDWISGKPDPLVGVAYKSAGKKDQLSRSDQAKVDRQSQLRGLFGAFRGQKPY